MPLSLATVAMSSVSIVLFPSFPESCVLGVHKVNRDQGDRVALRVSARVHMFRW